ncbi:hypothetical protein V1525DRAFT_396203 [Lipomyces kononenkoae]|uniref:Uncharacterized protein n=1 Tax=Lipomyces kononenkoae TaxID=34357 RepID=A0ACC3T8T6_LIPKO
MTGIVIPQSPLQFAATLGPAPCGSKTFSFQAANTTATTAASEFNSSFGEDADSRLSSIISQPIPDLELPSPSPPTKLARLDAEADVSNARPRRSRPKCYHCEYSNCGKSFTRPCRLEEHMRSHTGERPFVCTFPGCEKTFLRDTHLKAHESSHREEKRYKCGRCGHGFNTNQHLKRHQLIHEKQKPYACADYPPCEAAFHKQSQLRKHVAEVHTHTKPFVCGVDGCGRSFGQNSRLKAHQARDHGSQPRYLCEHALVSETGEGTGEQCQMRFQTWSALQKHIKTNHKAVCPECGAMFAKSGVLRQHMRVHEQTLEERRKFVCEYCERGFTRKHALIVHTSTVHEGRRPFACEEEGCNKAFGHKRLLKEHMAKAHSEGNSTDAKSDESKTDQESSNYVDVFFPSRAPLISQPDVIDRLAGTGYETSGRHIPCPFPACQFRFAREYDLARHVAGYHSFLSPDAIVEPDPDLGLASPVNDNLAVLDPNLLI